MERLEINLSDYRLVKWKRHSAQSLIALGATLVLGILCAWFIFNQAQQQQDHVQQLHHQRMQLERQLLQIQESIEKHKTQTVSHQVSLSPAAVTQFITLLQNLPIQGGLETARLFSENGTKLKLTGKSATFSTFETLEKALKSAGYRYQIEQFQTRDTQLIEFSILITLGD